MHPKTVAVDGKIYAIGGTRDNEASSLSIVEEYDPKTDTWIKKADMLIPRMRPTVSAINGKFYVISGSTVEEYDPKKDKWTKKPDIPIQAVGGNGGVVVNDKIYLIGIGTGPEFKTVVEYDPINDTWNKKADMPTSRWMFGTALVNNKIYVMGGNINPGFQAHSIATVEEYDIATDTWAQKADMPLDRTTMAVVAVNDKIYVIGGMTFPEMTLNLAVNVYDPKTDKWTQESDATTTRAYPSACLVDNKIYVVGGQNFGGYLSSVEEYTPEGWTFAISLQGKLPSKWGEIKR